MPRKIASFRSRIAIVLRPRRSPCKLLDNLMRNDWRATWIWKQERKSKQKEELITFTRVEKIPRVRIRKRARQRTRGKQKFILGAIQLKESFRSNICSSTKKCEKCHNSPQIVPSEWWRESLSLGNAQSGPGKVDFVPLGSVVGWLGGVDFVLW